MPTVGIEPTLERGLSSCLCRLGHVGVLFSADLAIERHAINLMHLAASVRIGGPASVNIAFVGKMHAVSGMLRDEAAKAHAALPVPIGIDGAMKPRIGFMRKLPPAPSAWPRDLDVMKLRLMEAVDSNLVAGMNGDTLFRERRRESTVLLCQRGFGRKRNKRSEQQRGEVAAFHALQMPLNQPRCPLKRVAAAHPGGYAAV